MNRWTNVLNHTKVIVPNDTKILLKKKKEKNVDQEDHERKRTQKKFRDSGKTPGRCCKLVDTKLRSLDTTKLFNN